MIVIVGIFMVVFILYKYCIQVLHKLTFYLNTFVQFRSSTIQYLYCIVLLYNAVRTGMYAYEYHKDNIVQYSIYYTYCMILNLCIYYSTVLYSIE